MCIMCPDSDIVWNQSLYCTSLQIIYTGYWSWFLMMTFHTWQSFPLSHSFKIFQNGRGPRLYTVVLYEIGNRWNAWLFPPPASVWMSTATCFFVPGPLWPAATRQSCIFQLLKQRFPVSSENLSKTKTIWIHLVLGGLIEGHPLSWHWPWSIRISKIQTWWTSSPPFTGVTSSSRSVFRSSCLQTLRPGWNNELRTTLAISAQRTTELVLKIEAWWSVSWKVQVMPFIGLEKKSLMTSKYSTSKLVTEASVKYALQMISPHTHTHTKSTALCISERIALGSMHDTSIRWCKWHISIDSRCTDDMVDMVGWLRSSHALLVYKLLHKQWLNTWPTNFNALLKTSNLSCHDAWCKLVQRSSQHGNHTSCGNLLWCACFDPITCCSIRPNRGQWGQIEWKWWSSTCKDLNLNSKRCFEDAPSVPRLFFVGAQACSFT